MDPVIRYDTAKAGFVLFSMVPLVQTRIQVLYCEFSALVGAHILEQNVQTIQNEKEFQMTESVQNERYKYQKSGLHNLRCK